MKMHIVFFAMCMSVLAVLVVAQNFVVSKKNPQKQSMGKLKEYYADELADLIKIIPGLQKQLATVQEQLIEQLYGLLDDELQTNKKELDVRTNKARELKALLENFQENQLPSKSSFARAVASVPEHSSCFKETTCANK